jgi:SAM-dependent methyltransferase
MLGSQLCTYDSLMSPELLAWADELRPAWEHTAPAGAITMTHRKFWEWVFLARALEERGMLQPGRRGLGFGVGQEPLVAAFAARGCEIVATDLDPGRAAAAGWVESEQHATGLADLNRYGLCDPDGFAERVTLRVVDMTDIPADLRGFDFTWSLCAFEHLGSLDAGLRFVLESMRCVRPGGVAAHTTEFNLSSDDQTVTEGPTVLYRRRDITSLVQWLRQGGHQVEPLDLTVGDSPADRHVDVPPFTSTHLRVQVGGFTATSLALVVRRRHRALQLAHQGAHLPRRILHHLPVDRLPGRRRRVDR